MYVIGERINGMFVDVKEAIQAKDASVIQALATKQMAAGATALDVNAGPASGDVEGTLLWLAESIRQVSDAPLAIDVAKQDVMMSVLPQVPGAKVINSTKADPELAMEYIGLAVENQAGLIGLTIDADGVPGNIEKRVELGAQIVALAADSGLAMDKLFIDPIILPVNVAPQNPDHCLQAISQIRMFADPPPHLVLGLSNVSQRCSNRSLINRTYVTMAVAHGLDAAIVDPFDTELMDAVITAELLLGRMVYCDSFLQAARQTKV
ncbi:MAG: dihydropteroate synthase [Planctomycetota bacterium]|jgi:5-methyltetrahydrofolate corrinoid/iron sulfur protein methyltransferase